MRVKVVDWNVNGFATTGQPDLLGSLEWDIACLQEGTEASWPLFRSLADHGDVASTTSHPWPEPRPRGPKPNLPQYPCNRPSIGCGIAGC